MNRGTGMNRRHDKHRWYHCNRPEHGVSSLRNSQSDPQCLELLPGARASVASCLNTIGRKIVGFEMVAAYGFIRDARY